jgi:hypothetical protein
VVGAPGPGPDLGHLTGGLDGLGESTLALERVTVCSSLATRAAASPLIWRFQGGIA